MVRAEVDGTGVPSLGPAGMLPVGRHRCFPEEVEKAFVTAPKYADSTSRAGIWSDVQTLVALVNRRRVRAPAIFLGGSFTTDKLNPSDADLSVVVDASRITSAQTWDALERMARETKAVGLRLDAWLIPWFPEGDESQLPPGYLQRRGKWDDFWQRYVPKPDRLPPQRHHALPVRGYLEVIFDGYQ